jgi:2-polyprenyl-6-methoxyphenol hydroxylase-like FAD-dependent oxidoreductase
VHVLIIGGGTGGMCLAQGLTRAGVSVAVYERDRTRSDGLHGYRVGINPTGNRALQQCLPPQLFATLIATCARSPRYFNVLTEKLRFTAMVPLRESSDPVDSERSVSRMTLRQVLFTGMEDVVAFGKVFTHYQQHDDGTVTAHFADGSTATGDVLVAADGANSSVRRQYLPHAQVEDTGIIAIGGKVPITAETKPLLPETCFHGLSPVFAPRGRFGIWHVMEFGWDLDGRVKSSIGGNDAELISRWPGLLFDNTRDYINWGFWASTDKYPSEVMDLRRDDLIRLVLDMTPDWHPSMRRLFALSDPGSCFPITIRTSVPIPPWPASTVTLLGDAIHTMTPGQGVGANTALRDAACCAASWSPPSGAPSRCWPRSATTRPRWSPTGSPGWPTPWPKTAPAAPAPYTSRSSAGSCSPPPAPTSAPSGTSPRCDGNSSTASTPTAAAKPPTKEH